MRLILDRDDLCPEHKDTSCSKIKFWHFTSEAQKALKAVGRATFREYDQSNYNAVRLPEEVAGG